MQGNNRDHQQPLIYAALPVGSFHGWGVCGKYLVKELSELADVKLIANSVNYDSLGDELEYRFLSTKVINPEQYHRILNTPSLVLKGPLIQSIVGNTLRPLMMNIRGAFNLGYTFFEDNILNSDIIEDGKRFFDYIITGSTWNERVLRDYGIDKVATIIQGIDPVIFNPLYPDKEYLKEYFVVFSGGKFELRKGQDIVIKAYKYLQDKYKDVMLINTWFNYWPQSMNTMAGSPHIVFTPSQDASTEVINKILAANGIDLKRVITLPAMPNQMMARLYKNTDIGLFPNRCEGGTNLVLMEYMACGKPVIASYNTGHQDILTEGNSIMLKQMSPMTISKDNRVIAQWNEPSLEEVISALQWAYLNRHSLRRIAQQAGRDMSKKTWKCSAERFYEVLTRYI